MPDCFCSIFAIYYYSLEFPFLSFFFAKFTNLGNFQLLGVFEYLNILANNRDTELRAAEKTCLRLNQ